MPQILKFSVCSQRKQFKARGFNLIELMITVAIAGILAAAAAPSFRQFIASQRVKTASFDLVAALTQTRSEAIKRNVSTPATISMTAASGGWANGWTIVYTDSSGTASVLGAKSAYTKLTIADLNGATAVNFRGDGRLTTGSTVVKFTVNSSLSISGVTPRCVSLSLSGQASSAIGSCS